MAFLAQVTKLQTNAATKLVALTAEGGDLKTLLHWSAEGMSFSKELLLSIPAMMDECSAVLLFVANGGAGSNRVYADFRGFGFTAT